MSHHDRWVIPRTARPTTHCWIEGCPRTLPTKGSSLYCATHIVHGPYHRTTQDLIEDVEWILRWAPHPPDVIAKRLGITERSLVSYLERARRGDLLTRMRNAA